MGPAPVKLKPDSIQGITMSSAFPAPILALPEADVPVKGAKAYLSQGDSHQVVYMHFSEDVDLLEHSHAAQWGIIIDGKVDLDIGGVLRTYARGDNYFVPDGVKHHGHIYAGLKVVEYFDQPDRYKLKV
jgi:quercetin dioxygenase-like cupin family protein